MEKQVEKVEENKSILGDDTQVVDVDINKKKTSGGKKVARKRKSVEIDERVLEENAKLDEAMRDDETATSYEEVNKKETEYRQFCVPIKVWFESESDYLKELKKEFKGKYDSASQELVSHVLELVTDKIREKKPSENSAEPKTIIKRNMTLAKEILQKNQNQFFASVNQVYNERAKKFNDAWEKIYTVKGKELVDASELEKAAKPEKLLEKALLDAIKDANIPNSGKSENYFNRAAKNMDRYSQYRRLKMSAKDEASNKKQMVDELANLMNSYADQKSNLSKEDKKKVDFDLHRVDFDLQKDPKNPIVYPKPSVDIVEEGFWDHPILTEKEIKEEIARRVRVMENESSVIEEQVKEKEFSSTGAINMIVKDVYNTLRWAENPKELKKEEVDELRDKLSTYYGDGLVSRSEITSEIAKLTENYDDELKRIKESRYVRKEEVQPLQESESYPVIVKEEPSVFDELKTEEEKRLQQDITWKKIEEMVGNSKKQNKESSEEWERLKEAAKVAKVKLEDARLKPLVEVREGMVTFDNFDAFKEDMDERVNATLKNYEIPERYLNKVKESMKTLYFQKKEFKKDSDTYTKNFADLLVKEINKYILPSVEDTKDNANKEFDACVEGMSKVQGSFANAGEVAQFVKDNFKVIDQEKNYWNDADMYLNGLHEMAQDTTLVDESRFKNSIADAIYQTSNEYERMAYSLKPECLDLATLKTTDEVGSGVLSAVAAEVAHHEGLRKILKTNPSLKESIVSHVACEVVLNQVEEEELNVESFRDYVTTSVDARKNKGTLAAFNQEVSSTIALRVDEFYNNIVREKEDLKDRFNELLTKGLSADEIKLELGKYTKEDNEVAINEVIKNYEEQGISDYKAFLDAYLSRTRDVDIMKFSKLTREYKSNLAFIKNFYKLDDVKLEGGNVSYEDKVKALEIKDKDAVKHLADFARYLQKEHTVNLERYMKLIGSLPFDIEDKMRENPKYFQMAIIDHYKHLQDDLTKDENGLDSLNNYDYRSHYRFLRRKDVGVERGSFPKRVGAFFARHWYKVASVGLLGYLAVSAMLFVPAATSFIGFIGGAALTYVAGAIVNTALLGKVPFLKDVIRNRRLAYGLSRREVERSTRRVDEMMNGKHMGIGYILKKVFTFGKYNKYGSITDRLDEANRLLDRMQSMSMKNAKQVKRTYKRIQKLLKAKGDGVLETENGTGIKYTSKFAKKIAKRLGIDENTAATEVTDRDYVDMFLNHKAEELHYDSTVEYNTGKVLGVFGKTRSVGYAIERLENHDKYATKMSNVWKITDAEGNVSYKKCKKNSEPALRRGETAEQLSVIDNYTDDFNNLVDEGKAIVSSTRVLLAKAERAFANNMRRVEKRMPEEELAQLKEEYSVNHKAAQAVMKSRREVNAEIKAEYHGMKSDRKAAAKGLSENYEEEKKRKENSSSTQFVFDAIDFDTMPKAEKEKLAFNKVTIDDEADKKEVARIKAIKSTKEQISAINELIKNREEKMNQVLASIAIINSIINKNKIADVLSEQHDDKETTKSTLTKEEKAKLELERKAKVDKVLKYFKGNKDLGKIDSKIKYSITEETLKKVGIELDLEQ